MPPGCRLVLVEWVDSAQPTSNWQFLSDFEVPEIVSCKTVGWLIHDGSEVKALAQNIGDIDKESEQVSGIMRIPAQCVVEIIELVESDVTTFSASDPSSHLAIEPKLQAV